MAEQAAALPGQVAAEGQAVQDQAKERAKALVAGKEPENKPEAEAKVEPSDLDEDLKKQPEKKVEQAGTPDKVIQQLQQNQSAINRKLDALLEKRDSGQELTDEDRAAIAKSSARLAAIKQKLGSYGEQIDGGTELAEEVVDLRQGLEAVADQAAKGDQTQAQIQALQTEVNWLRAENKYPNTDVHKVWDRAVGDAEAAAKTKLSAIWNGLNEQQQRAAIDGEANSLFQQRCDAVEARAASLSHKPANPSAPNVTGQYASTKVSAGVAGGATPEANPVEAQLTRARRLVRTNN